MVPTASSILGSASGAATPKRQKDRLASERGKDKEHGATDDDRRRGVTPTDGR